VVVWDRIVIIRHERHPHEHHLDAVRTGPAQSDLSLVQQGVRVGYLAQYRGLEIHQHQRRPSRVDGQITG